MKKYLLLTSVLALAACGGGSGGSSGTLSVTDSNARVTGMTSFVVVGGSNPTVNPNTRGATTTDDGGTQYDLENVTFKSIPTSGVIADLKFHTDENGKIVSMEYPDAQRLMNEHDGSDITVGPIMRRGDTNIFVERIQFGPEDGDLAGQIVDLPTEYVTYAKQLGLKYSDFGVLRTDIASTGIPELQVWNVMETPFMGGYDVKKVSDSNMRDIAQTADVVFSGLAKGAVSYHDWDVGIGGADIALEGGLNDENATLTFASDGSQTLAADFKNWAKIEAVKAGDGTNQFRVLNNYVDPSSRYYLGSSSPAGLIDGEMNEHAMAFQTGYYGDNNAPAEAVGLVQYQHQWGPTRHIESENRDDVEYHINVDLGFGGTRAQ